MNNRRKYAPHSAEVDLTVAELGESLRNDPNYHGGPIRLVACSAGKYENGAAQQLADYLGVDVYAPDMDVFIFPDGWYTLAEDEAEARYIRDGSLPERGRRHVFGPKPR